MTRVPVQCMSVSPQRIVICDRSSSIFVLDLARWRHIKIYSDITRTLTLTRCLEPALPTTIPSSSSHMLRLVVRVLHTYTRYHVCHTSVTCRAANEPSAKVLQSQRRL